MDDRLHEIPTKYSKYADESFSCSTLNDSFKDANLTNVTMLRILEYLGSNTHPRLTVMDVLRVSYI
jgi:hypothetical protein